MNKQEKNKKKHNEKYTCNDCVYVKGCNILAAIGAPHDANFCQSFVKKES